MTFATPLRDMRFALDHEAGFPALMRSGAYPDLAGDMVDAILGEAAKYCDEVVAPLNRGSDQTPSRLENGATFFAVAVNEGNDLLVIQTNNGVAAVGVAKRLGPAPRRTPRPAGAIGAGNSGGSGENSTF